MYRFSYFISVIAIQPMTVCIRTASGISAIALSLNLAFATAGFGQDAMQLDIDFKNSLSQAPQVQAPHIQELHIQELHIQGARHEEKNAGRWAEKGRPHEKGRHGGAVARR